MKFFKNVLPLLIIVMAIAVGCQNTNNTKNNTQNNTQNNTTENVATETTPNEEATPTNTESSVVTSNEFLEVTSPTPNTEIQSPVVVSGKSNFFEATTSIKIKDDNGNILADTFTQAGGYTELYPFSAEVTYTQPSAQTGVVEVFEVSAKDGSEINKISIPVKFKEALKK